MECLTNFFQVRSILDHLKKKTFTAFWWLFFHCATHFWFGTARNLLFGFSVSKSLAG